MDNRDADVRKSEADAVRSVAAAADDDVDDNANAGPIETGAMALHVRLWQSSAEPVSAALQDQGRKQQVWTEVA